MTPRLMGFYSLLKKILTPKKGKKNAMLFTRPCIFLPCLKILTFISLCSVFGSETLLQGTSWDNNDPQIIHLDTFLAKNYYILQAINPLDTAHCPLCHILFVFNPPRPQH